MTEYQLFLASKIKDVTFIHPIAAVAFAITAILIITVPRRKVLVPFFIMAMIIPYGQRIAIATLDFYLVRLLILIGLIRLYSRSELFYYSWNKIDKIFSSMIIISSFAGIILWQSTNIIFNRLGYIIDFLCSYILIRSLIRDFKDIDRIIKVFAIISVIIAVCMINEQITKKNIFHIFGGVGEYSSLRDERVRSRCSFGHPILAGVFGALFLPLFIYLWLKRKIKRLLATICLASTGIIVFTSSSSTPVFSYLSASFGILLFPFRRYMKIIKWGLLFFIIALHLYMSAPIWALLGRASIFRSSTAYHRYVLFDSFMRRIDEWWFLGSKSTEHWNKDISTWDVANEYVQIGTKGGLISLILFIMLIVTCFNNIGKGMKIFKLANDKLFLFWAVGTMLFTHLVTFWGVSYFGQSFLLWTLTIAMISTLSDLSNKTETIK